VLVLLLSMKSLYVECSRILNYSLLRIGVELDISGNQIIDIMTKVMVWARMEEEGRKGEAG
jgi:hypothetical protein